MALVNAVAPRNDPRAGGAFFNLAPPTSAGAGLIPAPGASGSGPTGVAAPTPLFAKNNSTSNIRIPRARVCPLGPKDAGVAVQMNVKVAAGEIDAPGQKSSEKTNVVTEAEHLHPNRLVFVLGKRGKLETTRPSLLNDIHHALPSVRAMPGGAPTADSLGTNRPDRLASFEYVQQFVRYYLHDKAIDLGENFADGGDANPFPKGHYGGITELTKPDGATSLIRMPDAANLVLENPSVQTQGINCCDLGPFLRGKGGAFAETISKIEKGESFRVSKSLGNEIAFDVLHTKLSNSGVLDWVPDGVILSRGHDGPSAIDDMYYEVKDGILFNIGIQGPCIVSNYANDINLEVLPGDKLYVLVVADVYYGDKEAAEEALGNAGTSLNDKCLNRFNMRNELLNTPPGDDDWTILVNVSATNATLCHFRLMLSTSSHMINTSAPDKRMGLRRGKKLAEYVVGGWCIGRVMDSAASRASTPGIFTTNRSASSFAVNANVDIGWKSGELLYREYGNNDGSLTARGDFTPWNPATQKEKAKKQAEEARSKAPQAP